MAAEAPSTAFTHCGTLWVAADAEEMQEAEHKRARLRAHGIACELLDARELAAQEPVLRPGLHGALRVGGDSMVYAPNAAEWLLGHAAQPIRVEALRASRIEGRRVHCQDGSVREGGAVLLAAGIHATQFCPELPIRPKKGHLAITDRGSAVVRHQLVELGYVKNAHQSEGTSVAFNLQPRPTGQWLLGSSRRWTTPCSRKCCGAPSSTCPRSPTATPSAPGRVFAQPRPMACPSSDATQSTRTCGWRWGTRAWA